MHTVHDSVNGFLCAMIHPHAGIRVKMLFIQFQYFARHLNALSRYYKFRLFLSARYI